MDKNSEKILKTTFHEKKNQENFFNGGSTRKNSVKKILVELSWEKIKKKIIS